MDKATITLIGPLGVGKSTLAALLSAKLGLPRCCYDDLKFEYLNDAGFDLSEAHEIRDAHGLHAMCMYTIRFGIDVL
jgi:adenylate kinase family enzyme